MKMFKFKDVQSTVSFYGHCSFMKHASYTTTWRHSKRNSCYKRATESVERAHPTDCPHVRPSVTRVDLRLDLSKTVGEDYAIFTVQ